ncbi:CDP-diacylglycerol--glycerol-3-phosphate 3-phosphatidyltransferase [Sulfitobacter sp. M57]|uniref:CDP-diacylglycerol--glycerol-3-phosphate 3-phosphatidyltransferase n=1 Tax=unclassified Sulfitobacter TaxID=196795 RepID=UPI0023E1E374|nr:MULTISPECIES: CDP-diacylglycerol--glycerol-3-phosphate 3-phosphatidyltransferase [unclassified Sulfitobacter]MDF3415525.1 CDP-diacylglycerol--glycerol-3-phosphate 3-phosphatidyltransferase [Sulfitobacter sp. KE5]MDF3423006.1 CDP-diacylglycerol--glycerol-3-phosphate 3-phosphatidyltransferase [Sulfitobacter sp. KE43]MDF3434071.1 CDP-diacylglycerol--glycerol-3-phosphate 3-phosphatidyltransferase [Sulfitobacter sp. KE42]MDF3459896.1 CDP-diacylglycerol--glycerol-3-phosphate 3-phosphatidyltransfer
MMWNLPNALTFLRLIAAPMVAVMFLYFTRPYADWFALLLFVSAAVTDWFDGYLARAWKQETKLGAMLDPIADKAMVVIALMVIIAFSSWSAWLVLPATVILFREVFVSGLREFLGDVSGTLKVTYLAKWKTTFQMTAIAVLFGQGVFEHYLGMSVFGMDEDLISAILEGSQEDVLGLGWKLTGMEWSGRIGLWLLWLAAALTAITGIDYLLKALPHLKEGR